MPKVVKQEEGLDVVGAQQFREPFPDEIAGLLKRLDAVVPEYERLWLARNRTGGMRDSVARIAGLADKLRGAAG